jgi:nitrous oxidase accessory protein
LIHRLTIKELVFLVFIIITSSSIVAGIFIETESDSYNTIYVDDDALCPGDGSKEWPYCKIQDAIDNASNGDIIYVFSGIYNENLIITKSLVIQGEDKYTTIINGSNDESFTIKLIEDHITFGGFTITSKIDLESIRVGIDIKSIKENVINNNIINSHYAAIEIGTSSTIIVEGNIINNNHYGIFNWNSVTTINNNYLSDNNCGLFLKGTSNIDIFQNIFINNTYGITFESGMSYLTGGNKIYQNNINNNSNGIYFITRGFGAIDNNEIFENHIDDNFYGIFFSSITNGVQGNKIFNNSISKNKIGILLNHSQWNKILSNNFINNKKSAYFELCKDNIWDKNYWDRPRLIPKLILGKTMFCSFEIFYFNIDWNPSSSPYEIL